MLSKAILNAHIGRDDLTVIFDLMIWVTRHIGPAIKPPIPKILSKETPLRCWDDANPAPVFHWASEEFDRLLSQMQMTDWAVELLPDGSRITKSTITPPAPDTETLPSRTWHEGHYPGYYVDNLGRPLMYYDPRQCETPGYLTEELLPQLSALRVYALPKPPHFEAHNMGVLNDVMLCHLGQGFAMLGIKENGAKSEWSAMSFLLAREDTDHIPYLYMSVMALMAHRYSPEQIISHYGPLLSSRSRKAVWPVYEAIEKQSEFIKLLRIMTENRLAAIRNAPVEHSRPRQAQS